MYLKLKILKEMVKSFKYILSFLLQGHCQAYEYGSEGCRMTTGGDPWDEYNQGYQQPQFSSATKLYSTLNFNIMSFSSIITVCKSAIIPFTLSFILHAI